MPKNGGPEAEAPVGIPHRLRMRTHRHHADPQQARRVQGMCHARPERRTIKLYKSPPLPGRLHPPNSKPTTHNKIPPPSPPATNGTHPRLRAKNRHVDGQTRARPDHLLASQPGNRQSNPKRQNVAPLNRSHKPTPQLSKNRDNSGKHNTQTVIRRGVNSPAKFWRSRR